MRTSTLLALLAALYGAATIGLVNAPDPWYANPETCRALWADSTATEAQEALCDRAADLAEDAARRAYGLEDGE